MKEWRRYKGKGDKIKTQTLYLKSSGKYNYHYTKHYIIIILHHHTYLKTTKKEKQMHEAHGFVMAKKNHGIF